MGAFCQSTEFQLACMSKIAQFEVHGHLTRLIPSILPATHFQHHPSCLAGTCSDFVTRGRFAPSTQLSVLHFFLSLPSPRRIYVPFQDSDI